MILSQEILRKKNSEEQNHSEPNQIKKILTNKILAKKILNEGIPNKRILRSWTINIVKFHKSYLNCINIANYFKMWGKMFEIKGKFGKFIVFAKITTKLLKITLKKAWNFFFKSSNYGEKVQIFVEEYSKSMKLLETSFLSMSWKFIQNAKKLYKFLAKFLKIEKISIKSFKSKQS